jgi:hypothetical protein
MTPGIGILVVFSMPAGLAGSVTPARIHLPIPSCFPIPFSLS